MRAPQKLYITTGAWLPRLHVAKRKYRLHCVCTCVCASGAQQMRSNQLPLMIFDERWLAWPSGRPAKRYGTAHRGTHRTHSLPHQHGSAMRFVWACAYIIAVEVLDGRSAAPCSSVLSIKTRTVVHVSMSCTGYL